MKYLTLITLLACVLMVCGCSTPGKATLLGAGVGTAAGAGVGAIAGGSAGNIIVGGALGGLLGASAGYIANDLSDKSNKEAFDRGKEASNQRASSYLGSPGQPTLVPPRIETRFVDDQVRGNTFVPAHVEYIITSPARWSR